MVNTIIPYTNKERVNFLIPLEAIYRNSLPESSSVFKRLKEGTLKPEDINLKERPKPVDILENPIIDFPQSWKELTGI